MSKKKKEEKEKKVETTIEAKFLATELQIV